MGIGVSVFLLAVGAVLTFAINTTVPHTDLDTIGVILMICGGIGLLTSLVFAATHRGGPEVEERVIEHDHTPSMRGT
jgi:hypothetical protein